MNNKAYWDSVAKEKEFTTELDPDLINKHFKKKDRIIDFGCGYGRTLAQLKEIGYNNTIGFDISSEMIARGLNKYPSLILNLLTSDYSNIKNQKYNAVLLFAVLTCIKNNNEQKELINILSEGLNRNGIIYLNDFLINDDERNLIRYIQYSEKYNQYGVFELPDGAVLRHHSEEWILDLFSYFEIILNRKAIFKTMNGNTSNGITIIARKK